MPGLKNSEDMTCVKKYITEQLKPDKRIITRILFPDNSGECE